MVENRNVFDRLIELIKRVKGTDQMVGRLFAALLDGVTEAVPAYINILTASATFLQLLKGLHHIFPGHSVFPSSARLA